KGSGDPVGQVVEFLACHGPPRRELNPLSVRPIAPGLRGAVCASPSALRRGTAPGISPGRPDPPARWSRVESCLPSIWAAGLPAGRALSRATPAWVTSLGGTETLKTPPPTARGRRFPWWARRG